MKSAVGVRVSTAPIRGAGAGSSPSTALHAIEVRPIPFAVAKRLVVRHHYLHSMPGGTGLTFGVFLGACLQGVIVFGAGPAFAHRLVEGAAPDDCLTLTRLWLSDALPRNSESRVLGIVCRALARHTGVKFLVSYADPSRGHLGTIYQAAGWLYTGLSYPMPLYDLGDGRPRHSRSLAQVFGSHSLEGLRAVGIPVKLVPQAGKHRYIRFLDRSWESKLRVLVLLYPKEG